VTGWHASIRSILCIGATLTAGLALNACDNTPGRPDDDIHNNHQMPDIVGQRIMYCDDDTRADVDFLKDGLEMAVTWLPNGKTIRLRAHSTGEEYRGERLKAIVAGGSIAFTTANGGVRICHRNEKD